MPIVISKLVQTKSLQEYLVDKSTGEALVAGVVTCYKDQARTELKNWYTQTGSYPNYSYVALPNPLTLSAIGTIVDDNGRDLLPMFYPWSESDENQSEFYFITVESSTGQQQFTRQKFPFLSESENPISETSQLKNLIINSRFWRGGGDQSNKGVFVYPLTNETDVVVLPSQHDGFSMPDIRFMKDTTGADDTCHISKFTSDESEFTNAIRPEYYINHTCSTTGTTESFKRYQIPISLHVATLNGAQAVFTIWAKADSTVGSTILTPSIFQFMGSSTSNTANSTTAIGNSLQLNSSWQPFSVSFTFPTTTGKTYDSQEIEDSALYLYLDFEPKVELDISFAIPGIFLGTQAPTTDFSSYDEIDTVINSPRTGDLKISSNLFGGSSGASARQNFGWIPLNDGSIGNIASAATTRSGPDVWPLYKLIYDNVIDTFAPVSGGRGVLTAQQAWEANKNITLPSTLGRVIGGANSKSNSISISGNTGVSTFDLNVSSSVYYTAGTPVLITNKTGLSSLSLNTVYYVIVVSPTVIRLALTLDLAKNGSATLFGTTGNATMITALGATVGNSVSSDVPSHVHPFTGTTAAGVFQNPGGLNAGSSGAATTFDLNVVNVSGTTDPNTGAQDIDLYQPTVYYNMLIKL